MLGIGDFPQVSQVKMGVNLGDLPIKIGFPEEVVGNVPQKRNPNFASPTYILLSPLLHSNLSSLLGTVVRIALGLVPTLIGGWNYAKTISKRLFRPCVRLVTESKEEHETEWAAIQAVAGRLNVGAERERKWMRRSEIDAGVRPGISSDDQAEIRRLKRVGSELRRANEILRKASAFSQRDSTTPRRYDPICRHVSGSVRGRADLSSVSSNSGWVNDRSRLSGGKKPPYKQPGYP